MTFTKIENNVIKSILTKHLEELENADSIPNDNAGEFVTLVEYEAVIKNILNKLQ